MNKNISVNYKSKKVRLIIALTLIFVLISIFWCVYVFNNKPINEAVITEKNNDNAKVIESEKNKDSVVISEDTPIDTKNPEIEESETENQTANSNTPEPTYDEYGPSTKLDRPDVHAVVLTTYSMYSDLLNKLQAVPEYQRQGVADQYFANNSSYFSPSFNYSSSESLHLFPQSYNVALPQSVRTYSAIVDPEDPTRVIVQIIMEPDASYSILAIVKTKDSLGNFGTFEKLVLRMNRNPL